MTHVNVSFYDFSVAYLQSIELGSLQKCMSCSSSCILELDEKTFTLRQALLAFSNNTECADCSLDEECKNSMVYSAHLRAGALDKLTLEDKGYWVTFFCDYTGLQDSLNLFDSTLLLHTDILPPERGTCAYEDVLDFSTMNFGTSVVPYSFLPDSTPCPRHIGRSSCFDYMYTACSSNTTINIYAVNVDRFIGVAWGAFSHCPLVTFNEAECRGPLRECENFNGEYCLHRKCVSTKVTEGLYSCWKSHELYRRPCFGGTSFSKCMFLCDLGDECEQACALECKSAQLALS
jgi:hypothetical protein